MKLNIEQVMEERKAELLAEAAEHAHASLHLLIIAVNDLASVAAGEAALEEVYALCHIAVAIAQSAQKRRDEIADQIAFLDQPTTPPGFWRAISAPKDQN